MPSTKIAAVTPILTLALAACNGAPEPSLYTQQVDAVATGYEVSYFVDWWNRGWAVDTPACNHMHDTICNEQVFTLTADCGAIPCAIREDVKGTPFVQGTEVLGGLSLLITPQGPGVFAPRFRLQHQETGEVVVLDATPITVYPPAKIETLCEYREYLGSGGWIRCDATIPLLTHPSLGTTVRLAFRITAADGTLLAVNSEVKVDGTSPSSDGPWRCTDGYTYTDADQTLPSSAICHLHTTKPLQSSLSLELASLRTEVSVDVQLP
jgi:hypothetical protein